MSKNWNFVLFKVLAKTYLLTYVCFAQSSEHFLVESYEWCANITNPTVKSYTTFKNFVPGNQIVDGNLSSPVNIGENTLLSVHLESEIKTQPIAWFHIFSITDDFCRIFRMYIGEFWYDIQRAAAITPKMCPVPKGNYHITNYKLNFQKLKLQTFPFGRLRITMQTQEKTTKKILSCTVGIVKNVVPDV